MTILNQIKNQLTEALNQKLLDQVCYIPTQDGMTLIMIYMQNSTKAKELQEHFKTHYKIPAHYLETGLAVYVPGIERNY